MDSDDRKEQAIDGSSVSLLVFFGLVFVVLLLLLFWPWTKRVLLSMMDPPSVHAMGPVVETRFVGGLSYATQVRTSQEMVLIRGAVELKKGIEVERRVTGLENHLCVARTERCFEVLSRE
jgi:hypothetical protein